MRHAARDAVVVHDLIAAHEEDAQRLEARIAVDLCEGG
jgi:hypothetical protein